MPQLSLIDLRSQLSGLAMMDESCMRVILHQYNSGRPSDTKPIQLVSSSDVIGIVKNTQEERNTSYQYIVKIKNHYTVIDLNFDEHGKANVVLVDAVNDYRMFHLTTDLEKEQNVNKVLLAKGDATRYGNLQKDTKHCFVFALVHAVALQNMNIHSHLSSNGIKFDEYSDKRHTVPWTYMPPEIVVYCQSDSLWEHFKVEHQRINNLSEDALAGFSVYRNEMKKRMKEIDPEEYETHKANIIPAVFKEFVAPALNLVNNKSEAQLTEMIYGATSTEETMVKTL